MAEARFTFGWWNEGQAALIEGQGHLEFHFSLLQPVASLMGAMAFARAAFAGHPH